MLPSSHPINHISTHRTHNSLFATKPIRSTGGYHFSKFPITLVAFITTALYPFLKINANFNGGNTQILRSAKTLPPPRPEPAPGPGHVLYPCSIRAVVERLSSSKPWTKHGQAH